MTESRNSQIKLRHGSEWMDHEDCIVGNKAGLQSLKNACEVALEKGEYFGNDLDEWVGVKELETSWFKDPQDAPSTVWGNRVLGLVLVLMAILVLVGLYTVGTWLFGVVVESINT